MFKGPKKKLKEKNHNITLFKIHNSIPRNIPRIFPTFSLNVGNFRECYVKYWQFNITLLWIWVTLWTHALLNIGITICSLAPNWHLQKAQQVLWGCTSLEFSNKWRQGLVTPMWLSWRWKHWELLEVWGSILTRKLIVRDLNWSEEIKLRLVNFWTY